MRLSLQVMGDRRTNRLASSCANPSNIANNFFTLLLYRVSGIGVGSVERTMRPAATWADTSRFYICSFFLVSYKCSSWSSVPKEQSWSNNKNIFGLRTSWNNASGWLKLIFLFLWRKLGVLAKKNSLDLFDIFHIADAQNAGLEQCQKVQRMREDVREHAGLVHAHSDTQPLTQVQVSDTCTLRLA